MKCVPQTFGGIYVRRLGGSTGKGQTGGNGPWRALMPVKIRAGQGTAVHRIRIGFTRTFV